MTKNGLQTQISVNITAHNEGLLIHKTLRSILQCIKIAEGGGVVDIEVNISLDKADKQTIGIVANFKDRFNNLHIYKTDYGDLGDSRNFLISKSSGKYIAFFDGDDFFSENYLLEAYNFAEQFTNPAVYSPKYLVSFEGHDYIINKLDSNDESLRYINLFEFNYFISQSFVHSAIYKQIKYRPNSNGYGMEDWDWNMRVLQAGYKFINIPDTIFFYRRKKVSLLTGQVQTGASLRLNSFFEPNNFAKLPGYKITVNSPILETPSTFDKKSKYKANLKKIIKIATFNKKTAQNYLRDLYILHKRLVYKVSEVVKAQLAKHSQVTEIVQEQQLPDNLLPQKLVDIGFTDSLLKSWQDINKYEPMIRASNEIINHIDALNYPTESLLSIKYYEFCKKYKNRQFDDVLVVPHIVRGGADLAIIKLVEAILYSSKKDILVFSTLNADSPWSDHITKYHNVVFIEMHEFLKDIEYNQRLLFLLRILQNWKVKRFNIVNSEMGYDLLKRYGRVVNDCARTYLHTYAYDMDEEGYLWNWIKNGLVDTYPFVNMFITDSLTYKKQLMKINGFEDKKIVPLYLPIDPKIKIKKSYKITKKILWASRVSDSKLVDVAVEIAKGLKKYKIEIHFYGSIDPEYKNNNRFLNLIAEHDNIKYKGVYNGYASLPVDEYDIFLLTSKNEGMPNVILESLKANLFVVAPAVGGIVEVIEDGQNGFLVSNNLIADEYIDKILDYYDNESLHNRTLRDKVNSRILDRHNLKAYQSSVKNLFNIE